ncbi:DUF308 domain-containing protein [Methanobacterium oryzae]|uniref:DUF308 domain-containing protein n=1 Tax=Methanobacterium oryzae TaxID=69540 RepID=UPI003D1B5772
MEKNGMALVFIILGLFVLAFPLLGLIPISVITGFIVLIAGIGLIISGLMERDDNRSLRILKLILGVITFFLGMAFVVNPGLFSWLTGLLVWIIGLFLIISGIIEIITKSGGSRWNGVIALIVGLLYTIIGNFITDPRALGALIGLWLLITGVLMFFMKE